MEGVVIYKSKYGATEQYARWIGAALKLPIIKAGEFVTVSYTHLTLPTKRIV